MSFAIVLGQFSYIYNLGETGCYSIKCGVTVLPIADLLVLQAPCVIMPVCHDEHVYTSLSGLSCCHITAMRKLMI
jgi:hypothetical protein